MFEILTPLNKVERVTRKINPATFTGLPGFWAVLESDGSLSNNEVNSGGSVENPVNKLVIGDNSTDPYEAHTVQVGRISTAESIGIRIRMDNTYFTNNNPGNIVMGAIMCAGYFINLVPLANTFAPRLFEAVARVEEFNADKTIIVIRTIQPYIVDLT